MNTLHRNISKNEIITQCRLAAKEMRRDALRMTFNTGNTGAHIGGGLSMIEIMAVLYLGVMRYDSSYPMMEERDRFILSKGHGTLGLYTALRQAGFLTADDLLTYKKNDTELYAHPSMNLSKAIEFSSGSLGQGLSLGVGTCIALKRKNNRTSRVFVMLGDGECDEGSVWEAAASAAHYECKNLIAVIDKNMIQYDGATADILSMDPMAEKWRSFGWNAITVDGHDIEDLYDALTRTSDKPLVVIAETTKGKGVSFMENNPHWHNARLTQGEFDVAMAEQEE